MTAVDLSDSDKKKLQILYCNVFMENYITGIQLWLADEEKGRNQISWGTAAISLSLFYIYTLYVIGIELIVGIRALGAFCTVIATFLISERDGNFKTKLINLIILAYQISKL